MIEVQLLSPIMPIMHNSRGRQTHDPSVMGFSAIAIGFNNGSRVLYDPPLLYYNGTTIIP